MKAEALRDDENVFDVAFEGMGTDEPTASATDVKVRVNGGFILGSLAGQASSSAW
jgi:hypothetical protein